jgi:alpha-mannosidase
MKKPTIHLICSAHLDPVWQWQWEEGCSETLTTFRTAIQLLNEFPAFVFTHNESVLYRWVESYDPALFKSIKKMVKANRWCISGGWFLQPDLNLPDTESILRQIMEGRRYFYKKFDTLPQVAYNFDVFGHSSGLPQILNLAGYKFYIHMRPEPHQLELPADLYQWRGIDGSIIPAFRTQIGFYHHEYDNLEEMVAQCIDLALKLDRDVPLFYGLGDHGGGATREALKILESIIRKEKRVKVMYSSPEILYTALKREVKNAPVYEQELQRCFTGCYASMSRVKRRQSENLGLLVQSETLCAANWWQGSKYPEKKLQKAWRRHLFNDFHDILPGSGTRAVERDALDLYGCSAQIARDLRFRCAVAMTQNRPGKDIALTVLNNHPIDHPVAVEAECMMDYRPRPQGTYHLRLFDQQGNEIPCQEEAPQALISYNGWRRKISFLAKLPSAGAIDYKIKVCRGEAANPSNKPKLNHKLDPESGLISQLFVNQSAALSGPLFKPLWIKDVHDSWGDDCQRYDQLAESFKTAVPAKPVNDGPIRSLYQSRLQSKTSDIVYNIYIYKTLPLMEFRLFIRVLEKHRMLKLEIPSLFHNLFCEIPGAAIERAEDGREFVHGRWMILSQHKQNGPALAVINNGQHGYDFADGTVRLSILRTPHYCHESGFKAGQFPVRTHMDQGFHDIRLLVLAGDYKELVAEVGHYADWLTAPPFAVSHLTVNRSKSKANKKLPISISDKHIRLLAVKRSMDKNALIVRLQETAGSSAKTQIKIDDRKTNLTFKPFEIKTLRLEKTGKPKGVDFVFEC